MRKLPVIAACLVVLFSQGFPPAKAGEEPLASANGDCNGDGERDIGDAVYLLSWLLQGGPAPLPLLKCDPPLELNGDCNGDEARDIGDAVYLLSWLFQGGPAPVLIDSCDQPLRIDGFTYRGLNDQGYPAYSLDALSQLLFVRLPWGPFEMGSRRRAPAPPCRGWGRL